MDALAETGRNLPVLALLHPRTRKALGGLGLDTQLPGVQLASPVGYLDMVSLLQDARFCLTDSGGLVEEAAVLRTPALVLRHETEHRQYVECGIHVLVGQDTETIIREATTLATDDVELDRRRSAKVPVRTGATDRIIATMKERLAGVALRPAEITA
jgi:UDP-N-acetylglucosamine 2-epimerase (non-hydrolysing)